MNTRLQVEHPVTEAVTGLDLVAWQLRVAAGEKLPLAQQQIPTHGHAIEARLYAEDPQNSFLPQSGTLIDWQPASGVGVRVDHGLAPGAIVSPFYDPLLAKIVAHGADREEARRRLIAALEDSVAFGPVTNRGFLVGMLRHPAFVAGDATTAFIDRYFSAAGAGRHGTKPDQRTVALAAVLLFEAGLHAGGNAGRSERNWASTGVATWPLRLTLGNAQYSAGITAAGPNDYLIALDGGIIEISLNERGTGAVRYVVHGVRRTARFALHERELHLDADGDVLTFRDATFEAAGASGRRDGSSRLVAPMNGVIVGVLAKPGDRIARGQRVIVLEAMKMQHDIGAARDGTVDKVLVKPGDQVATRQLLVELKPEESTEAAP
jgi:geranyl-CoA carboxylase alpha subunit